jgi:hypothetical protein
LFDLWIVLSPKKYSDQIVLLQKFSDLPGSLEPIDLQHVVTRSCRYDRGKLTQRTNQDPIAAVFSSLAARIGRIKIGLQDQDRFARGPSAGQIRSLLD